MKERIYQKRRKRKKREKARLVKRVEGQKQQKWKWWKGRLQISKGGEHYEFHIANIYQNKKQ